MTSPPISTEAARENKPMRVLHVIDDLNLGGAERLMVDMLHGLANRQIELRLCVVRDSSTRFAGHELPVEPVYLGFSGEYRNPLAVWRCAQRLRSVVQREAPQVVHSHLWLSDYLTALAVRRTTARHISHIVDRREWQTSRRLRHRLRRWQTRRAFRKADSRFLAVSAAARDFACANMGWHASHVRVVYNSIDVSRFGANGGLATAPETRLPVVGTASRLAEEKGHPYLLEAAAQLRERGYGFRLLITGNGPEMRHLAELGNELGVADLVEFVGRVPDMASFYRKLDIFVVPSIRAEGLPSTILEAMASQKAVVVTDVGGATEAVRHESEGLVIPPRDATALADAIERILVTPDFAASMAAAARQRVYQMFTVERMTDQVIDAYRDILNGTWGVGRSGKPPQ